MLTKYHSLYPSYSHNVSLLLQASQKKRKTAKMSVSPRYFRARIYMVKHYATPENRPHDMKFSQVCHTRQMKEKVAFP